MRDTILVGGSHIEFGWNLQFIARARAESNHYQNVVVACEPQYEYLYRDFATKFEFYDSPKGLRDRWLFNKKEPLPPKKILEKYKGAKLFYPTEDRCKRDQVEWFNYGIAPYHQFFNCVLVHARNITPVRYDKKVVGKSRNWPIQKWYDFVHSLDCRIISIGDIKNSKWISGTKDIRGTSLEILCCTMNRSSVIVGESSGPLHLASLCGCPQVVITHNHKEKSLDGKTNRWRYEKGWNPFNTPCTVLDEDNWDPPVEKVVEAVRKYL
jgi:hypothetical protein